MTLWLVGMMGSGKTTAGRLAAERLEVPFEDTDAFVAERMGCSIAQLWGSMGEEVFRDMEQLAVTTLAARSGIVSTGGGAVMVKASQDLIARSPKVVWLDAHPSVLEKRLGDTSDRPGLVSSSLSTFDYLKGLLAERAPTYRSLATHRIETDNRDSESVAEEICEIWTS